MSDPRARSPGKFIYHQNPPIYIYTSPSVCQQTNPPRTFTCQPVTDQDHLTWPLHKSAVPPEATSQIGMPMTKVTMARPGQSIGHPHLFRWIAIFGWLLGLRLDPASTNNLCTATWEGLTSEKWTIPRRSRVCWEAWLFPQGLPLCHIVLPGLFDNVCPILIPSVWSAVASPCKTSGVRTLFPWNHGNAPPYSPRHVVSRASWQHPDAHRLLIGARQSILRLVGTGCSVTLLRILPRKKNNRTSKLLRGGDVCWRDTFWNAKCLKLPAIIHDLDENI